PLPDSDEQIVVADRDATTGLPAVSELVSMAGPGDPNKTLFDNIADNAARCLTGGEGCAVLPDISDDGRYVTFATEAPNLVVRHAVTLPGADIEGDCGFENCDDLVVDRDATSNAGGPQHVNEPPADVRELQG